MTAADGWQPSTVVQAGRVSADAAAALHDLLDTPGAAPAAGMPLPPLWHWLTFPARVRQSELGEDGHPRTGRFLPPAPGRRRMAAGGALDWRPGLLIDADLVRTSRVSVVRDTVGRTGSLRFVTVAHDIEPSQPSPGDEGEPTVRESSDLVYRPPVDPGSSAAASPAPASAPVGAPAADEWSPADPRWSFGHDIVISPTLLFRFSALTYNAHRIHYDRPYATGVEGYPGLVVQGPLQAVLLAELLRVHRPDHRLTHFSYRSVAAAFDDDRLCTRAIVTDEADDRTGSLVTVRLTAYTRDGRPTMRARALLAAIGATAPSTAPSTADRP